MEYTRITAREIADTPGLDDWRFILQSLQANFTAPTFPTGAALIGAIAEAAERMDHHPDLDMHYPGRVHVTLSTHSAGGVTDLDVELAREISRLAVEHQAVADTSRISAYDVAIDTMDADRIRPFWLAVLAYKEARGYLVDPQGIGPTFWFQQMDEPRTHRDRFHIDVTVPHDQAEARIAAAIAAGGKLVTDEYARSWWVLADADGNEACVCTWQDRG